MLFLSIRIHSEIPFSLDSRSLLHMYSFFVRRTMLKKTVIYPKVLGLVIWSLLTLLMKTEQKITDIDNKTYINNIDTINKIHFCDIMKMWLKEIIPLFAGPRPTSTAASARVPWPSPYRPWRVSRVASLGKRSRAAARRRWRDVPKKMVIP